MLEHANGGFFFNVKADVIEVMGVNNFFDAGLNDGLGALDTREEVDVNAGALKFTHIAAEIQNGIEFAVADVGVFCIVVILSLTNVPRHHFVGKTIRGAIVADGQYAVIITGDAGANLSVGVFATH